MEESIMKKVIIPIILLLLVGCDGSETDSKDEAQKAAAPNMLKGEAAKSPVLDYSRFDGPPSLGNKDKPTVELKPVIPNEKPAATGKDSSGFKKSPVLDYSKF
jgi:hypothetical protein